MNMQNQSSLQYGYQAPQQAMPVGNVYQAPQQTMFPGNAYQAPQPATLPGSAYQAPRQETFPANAYQAPQQAFPTGNAYQAAPCGAVGSPYGNPVDPFGRPLMVQPIPYVANAQIAALPETPEVKADRFSRASAALIVLGLVLVGGAIGPLLTFFNVVPVGVYWIGVAYLILAALTVSWLVGKLFSHSPRRDALIRTTRVAVLAAAETALLILANSCSGFAFNWEATAVLLTSCLLAMHFAPSKDALQKAYSPLRINEIAVIIVLALIVRGAQHLGFWGGQQALGFISLACYTATLAMVVALMVLRVRELFSSEHPASANAGFLVTSVLAFLAFATAYVWGCTPLYNNVYAYDVVFMATALLCVVMGFAAEKTTLRHVGLVLAMATIAKMVVIDTWSYELLSRAIAYLIGGAVCFGIGVMYNYAVKCLFKQDES